MQKKLLISFTPLLLMGLLFFAGCGKSKQGSDTIVNGGGGGSTETNAATSGGTDDSTDSTTNSGGGSGGDTNGSGSGDLSSPPVSLEELDSMNQQSQSASKGTSEAQGFEDDITSSSNNVQ